MSTNKDAVDLIVHAFRDFARRIHEREATTEESRIAYAADALANEWERISAKLSTLSSADLKRLAGK